MSWARDPGQGGPGATLGLQMPSMAPNEAYMISGTFPGWPRQGPDHTSSCVTFRQRKGEVLALEHRPDPLSDSRACGADILTEWSLEWLAIWLLPGDGHTSSRPASKRPSRAVLHAPWLMLADEAAATVNTGPKRDPPTLCSHSFLSTNAAKH